MLRAPEFRRFLIVGVFNTALGYGLYLLLDLWLHYVAAYLCMYAIGIFVQYFLHSKFVYRTTRPRGHMLAFPLLHVLIASFGTFALWVIVELTPLTSGPAGLGAIAAQTPLAFIATRWWFATANAPQIAVRIALGCVLPSAFLLAAVIVMQRY
jgi:putative flippase GtrA